MHHHRFVLGSVLLVLSACAPDDGRDPALAAECRAAAGDRFDYCSERVPSPCWDVVRANCEDLRGDVAVAVARCFEDAPCQWSFNDPNTIEPCLEAVLEEHRTAALDELAEAVAGWGPRVHQPHGAALLLRDDDVRAIARCYREPPVGDRAMVDACLRAVPGPALELMTCNSF